MQPSGATADLGQIETPTPETTPEPNATPTPEPTSTPTQEPLETPSVEGTPEGTQQTAGADAGATLLPEIEDEFNIEPDKIEGKQYFFREPKAKQLLADHTFVRELDTVIPGATVNDLKAHYQRSISAQQMLDDFHSGDPANMDRWLNFHFSAETNPQSMALMAEGLMQRLPQLAPQIYERVKSGILSGEVQSMYKQALQSGDERLLKLAQNIDFKLTGGFKTVEQLQAVNPFQAEREQFERERQQFYTERQNEWQSTLTRLLSEADAGADAAQLEEIEAALAPVAESLKGKPQWEYMVHALSQKVQEAKQANQGFMREYEILRQRFKQSPSAESRKLMADKMRTFVKRVIAPHRKGVIDAVAQPVLNASAQATQKAQQTATARPEPAGGGKPVNPTGDLAAQAKKLLQRPGGADVKEIMALVRG